MTSMIRVGEVYQCTKSTLLYRRFTMPKITYPRPCPTCGKPLSKTQFHYHKKVCSGHRYHCKQCERSFSQTSSLRHHVEQQHSLNPPRFYCPKCGQGFARKHNRDLHLQTVEHDNEVLVKPQFHCVECSASFTRKCNLQSHERYVHKRIRRPYEMNLRLHLQKLCHNHDGEWPWMFVKSRRVRPGEPRVCPCGQTGIRHKYYFKIANTSITSFVGSTCILNVDRQFGRIIAYFERVLTRPTRGIYHSMDREGLHWFQVNSTTTLVLGALQIVHKYNPPVVRHDGKWYVKVMGPAGTLLRPDRPYQLWLKADYEQEHLLFTIQYCRESTKPVHSSHCSTTTNAQTMAVVDSA